jgi:hypothetical protein
MLGEPMHIVANDAEIPSDSGDHRGVPDFSDQFAVAARVDPQDAVAIPVVVVCDALNMTRENFPARWFRLRFHADRRIVCSVAESTICGQLSSPNPIRNDRSVGSSLAIHHGVEAQWWGWVRTRSEPTETALIGRSHGRSMIARR